VRPDLAIGVATMCKELLRIKRAKKADMVFVTGFPAVRPAFTAANVEPALGRCWNHLLALLKEADLDAAVFKAAGFVWSSVEIAGQVAAAAAGGAMLAVARVGAVKAAGAGFLRIIRSHYAGGSCGTGANGGVAFDHEGNLVVPDVSHCVQVFRYSDGTYLRSMGSYGADNGQFYSPWGVAFDAAGHIVVSSLNGAQNVQVLKYADGSHVRTIGRKGEGVGQLKNPRGIAVDSEGNVAVCDSGNHRVQVFRLSDGAHLLTIGSRGSGSGQLSCPCGVAFDLEGNLVVADSQNHRVQVLRYKDGAHVRSIGSKGAGAGQLQDPVGVVFDAAGHLVVLDQNSNRVQVLRYADGSHIRTIGIQGAGNEPYYGGIAIDSDGRMVVASYGSNVQILE
jgi:DNA-binding beta-propeller fold protein YncE